MRGSRKFSHGGVQIPRRGLAENFNMAKINNLAIPVLGVCVCVWGGGGGGPDPLVPPSRSAHVYDAYQCIHTPGLVACYENKHMQ